MGRVEHSSYCSIGARELCEGYSRGSHELSVVLSKWIGDSSQSFIACDICDERACVVLARCAILAGIPKCKEYHLPTSFSDIAHRRNLLQINQLPHQEPLEELKKYYLSHLYSPSFQFGFIKREEIHLSILIC